MPSLGDSAVIIFLGLLLFGPKGLAQIARQIGKLMGEFRRASNEFRMQMEEELRVSEQADRQKQIAAIEAAAPVAPPVLSAPADELLEEHPHMRVAPAGVSQETTASAPEPLPIATSGGLNLMPPATGLPAPRTSSSSVSALLDSVPHADPAAVNGHEDFSSALAEKPMRYTNGNGATTQPAEAATSVPAEETLHG